MSNHPDFTPFAQRMQAEGLPNIFIDTFAFYYAQLVTGQTGMIPENGIEAVTAVPDTETFPLRFMDVGAQALAQTAVIKLNGGLGTSMGLQKAKSLLPVRDGLSFLDIIARQTIVTNVPLILMNSFVTNADSLALLEKYPQLQNEIPLSFMQHKEPKINQADFSPAIWPENPNLEWCPPGHGDIYTALVSNGTLDALLAAGYEYAFVSNADNLGAVMDKVILGYFAENQFPFMMEVADRTTMDKKGGHLAQQPDGQLILRELAQCPPADMDTFQDISLHKYFNTNNLWLNLPALKRVMQKRHYKLGLPMIVNAKTVDPRDRHSTPVYQLETAMGAAVGVFPGAQAVRVPRTRFAPVKKSLDLLAVRSDAYVLTDDFHILPNPERTLPTLVVELDDRYYKLVDQLAERFPNGIPSLIECTYLSIQGDVKFGRDVVCRGEVILKNEGDTQMVIPDGAILG
ncbi:MAG: UTP--glucose-1-phosphate uridylyltransferase [Anaerolineales bacterium]|nr:UTP--glucose-1-phosphate uridylyltransferase [Anaerolineales bacterium]